MDLSQGIFEPDKYVYDPQGLFLSGLYLWKYFIRRSTVMALDHHKAAAMIDPWRPL